MNIVSDKRLIIFKTYASICYYRSLSSQEARACISHDARSKATFDYQKRRREGYIQCLYKNMFVKENLPDSQQKKVHTS